MDILEIYNHMTRTSPEVEMDESDIMLDGIAEEILADGKIERSELYDLEKRINEDGRISRDEMRDFCSLIQYGSKINGKSKFTPEALEYIDKHFMNVKEKAQNEFAVAKSLIYSGIAVTVIGVIGMAVTPSVIPFYLGAVGCATLISGMLLSGDGSVVVDSRFDVQGRLMII